MSDLYKMVMALKKAVDDLEVKKRELSIKITEMKSSTTFFCLPMRSPDKGFLVPTTTSSDARSPSTKGVRRRDTQKSKANSFEHQYLHFLALPNQLHGYR